MDVEVGISVRKNSVYKGMEVETKRPELSGAFMKDAVSSWHSLRTQLNHHQAGELSRSGVPGLPIVESTMLCIRIAHSLVCLPYQTARRDM